MEKTELEENLIRAISLRKATLQEALINWGERHYRHFPWREKRTPYSVLISEILLKRTTASAVNRMYATFMSTYPDLSTLANADRGRLKTTLATIGYHKRRTGILIEIAENLLTKHNGRLPKSLEDLLEIPFVGPYTANAVLSLGYNIPAAMVDSNIERIIRRLFFDHFSKKAPLRFIQEVADMLCLPDRHQEFNYALLDFGASVCRYGTPKCELCPITESCDYYITRPDR